MTIYEPKPLAAHDTAPSISLVEGEVVLFGPGALAFSMTWAAAQETHRRLGEVLRIDPGDPDPQGSGRLDAE